MKNSKHKGHIIRHFYMKFILLFKIDFDLDSKYKKVTPDFLYSEIRMF